MTMAVVWLLEIPGLMATGGLLLVVIGLLIRIPIVIWGSTFILRWVTNYPGIVLLGVAVLAWTAAKMIVSEPVLEPWFATHEAVRYAVYGVLGPVVVGAGLHYQRRRPQGAAQAA